MILSFSELSKIYSPEGESRVHSLVCAFEKLYGQRPDFIARAPGRVNIIGEHIDYEGYGVLPAAVENDCIMAVSLQKQATTIRLNHMNQEEEFLPCEFPIRPNIEKDTSVKYAKYFIAGYLSGIGAFNETKKLNGLYILMNGNIPLAAGLSSSSAFCVCAALVGLHANEGLVNISSNELIERCIAGERAVGTASGGMDQSISILGKANCCLHIEFNPIRCKVVSVPEGYVLFVMNTLVESAKLDTAIYRYNKRVCECRIGLYMLSIMLGIDNEIYKKWKILKEIQEYLKLSPIEMIQLINTTIKQKPYTQKEIEAIIQSPLEQILDDIQRSAEVIKANLEFNPFEALIHVYSETSRVDSFIHFCETPISAKSKAEILGTLMNESQKSCAEVYQCSCPELNEITTLAINAGAVGSRLTGAGWGGCAIALVPENISSVFLEKILEGYYYKHALIQKGDKYNTIIFGTKPSGGACVFNF